MKPYLVLDAELRQKGKKSLMKKIAKSGLTAGVIYVKDGDNLCISLSAKQTNMIVSDPSAMTRVYEINVDGKKFFCVLKEVQFNPTNDLPRHIDFQEVKSGDKVVVNVPVRVINKDICPGVKNGGDVYVLSYNVALKCNVENIPYAIEVDVKDSNMGEKFFLSNVKIPEGCSIIKDVILIRIAGRRVIKDVAKEETADAGTTADTSTSSTDATTTTAESAK
ncbi:MAG: 50S ribosomal protein L25 [Rickettsiales bacterium]|nr:50S ribosomal protein L25 [Rickettsiales bacterium]